MTSVSSITDNTDAKTVICACAGFTLGDLQGVLRGAPQMTFDDLLTQTKAGGRCTACLLDLEHHFVAAPRLAGAVGAANPRADSAREPWRRRLMRMMDRFSPAVALSIPNVFPVIRGDGIEQFLWFANHSLMFERAECAPPMSVRVTVRNADGRVVHNAVNVVEPEKSLRINVSQYLPTGGADLTIGSATVVRRFKRSGHRGTTRPQTEIVARDGACAVHGQGASHSRESWLTALARPDDERLFLTLVNCEPQPQTIEVAFPFTRDCMPKAREVVLPPHGATLAPIDLEAGDAAQLRGKPFSIRWRPNGRHRAHVLCATPSLGRFSIDHL